MISVDTVYQRVLASANKEQRGYVTPQEFNLYANQAQMDIFDQFFYDVDKFSKIHGNETESSDMLDLLNEKIDVFEMPAQVVAGGISLPSMPLLPEIYILGNIFYSDPTGVREAERVSKKEWVTMFNSPLTQPRIERPVYFRYGRIAGIDQIRVWIHNPVTQTMTQALTGVTCNYIRRPVTVNWGYAVINGYAQFDNTNFIDFELHPSEENNLVYKILELAGIVMKDQNLYQIASQEEIKDIQQEKS